MRYPTSVLMKTDRIKEGIIFYDTATGEPVYLSLDQIKKIMAEDPNALAGISINSTGSVVIKTPFQRICDIGRGVEGSVTVVKRLIGQPEVHYEIVDAVGNKRSVSETELLELRKSKCIAGIKFIGNKMLVSSEVETVVSKQ